MKSSEPNLFLLPVIAGILFICSFFLVDQTFDFRIYDTFYVINLRTVYWCITILILLCYLIYKILPSLFTSIPLIKFQITLTAIVILLIIGYHLWSGQNRMLGRPLNLYDVVLFHQNNLALTMLLLLLGFVQVILLINVLRSQLLLRKRGKQV